MPVTSLFDSNNPTESTEKVLKEWLLDFYPASTHIIAFQQPADPTKPTIWLQKMPSTNVDMVRARKSGKTVQRKEFVFMVSALSRNRAEAVKMADKFERHAILGSGSALAVAGLRYAEVTPFEDVIVDTQVASFRRSGIFKFTVTVTKE